ncbi:MAG: methyltransferase, TIGR04325 family [Bacteroidales bacterium]|nr:methyltransferase, TIGR04325 family [Bacteroidales bacterium]
MIKDLIKDFLPPIFIRFLSGLFYGWHGNYSSWDKASKLCFGYNSQLILEKVRESTMMVKSGKAVYERDSFIFNEIQYSYPVLSSLMWIAAQNNGNLTVLDFGGSLGSSYYQNKLFLDHLNDVKWCIVEQPNFVKVGLEQFSDDKLKFYYTIDDCIKDNEVDVVLLSSVLQYIEKPYELLELLKVKRIPYILFDRTQFLRGDDRITIQKVNPAIYKASYPCWFFNKQKLLSFLESEYELIIEFDTLGRANIPSEFKGFLYKLKKKKYIISD